VDSSRLNLGRFSFNQVDIYPNFCTLAFRGFDQVVPTRYYISLNFSTRACRGFNQVDTWRFVSTTRLTFTSQWWWLLLSSLLEKYCSDCFWNSLVFSYLASHSEWRCLRCSSFYRWWKTAKHSCRSSVISLRSSVPTFLYPSKPLVPWRIVGSTMLKFRGLNLYYIWVNFSTLAFRGQTRLTPPGTNLTLFRSWRFVGSTREARRKLTPQKASH